MLLSGGVGVGIVVCGCEEGGEFIVPVADVVCVVEVGGELCFAFGFLVAEAVDEFIE